MGRSKGNLRWGFIQRKIFRSSSHQNHHESNAIIVLHTNISGSSFNSSAYEDTDNAASHFMYTEDMAAITIQTFFRGHLARRAYRALRSLVKLQALVRGVVVRRQARIALHCMQALARLQITVRARQLLLINN
ncbi:hypothetical protein ABFS83_08G211200 [Erythranthe nasuta]